MATPVPIVDGQRYKDRVTIVTGGARGIGEGIVKLFVKHGAKVVAVDKRECPSWLAEVNTAGPGSLEFYQCDLTRDDQVQRLINYVSGKYGQIDCLINNAGWHPPHKKMDELTIDDMRSAVDINLFSQFLTCKYSLPYLRKTKGNVINITSISNVIGQLYAVPYVAAKAGVLGFTKALAIDEAKYHVRVNAVAPGCVLTPLWEELNGITEAGQREDAAKNTADIHLLGVVVTPEDIGLACMYLAADAVLVTGCELPVMGGAELDVGYKTRLTSDEVARFMHLKK